MIHTGFRYIANAWISFTPAEVELLMEMSAKHYDSKCQDVGRVGGFIYGTAVRLKWSAEMAERDGESMPTQITVDWSFGECDIAAKICEIGNSVYYTRPTEETVVEGMYWGLRKALDGLNEEYRKLNRFNGVSGAGAKGLEGVADGK